MLGQVGQSSNDINKFHRNFFWLKFKVNLQDMQISGQTRFEYVN